MRRVCNPSFKGCEEVTLRKRDLSALRTAAALSPLPVLFLLCIFVCLYSVFPFLFSGLPSSISAFVCDEIVVCMHTLYIQSQGLCCHQWDVTWNDALVCISYLLLLGLLLHPTLLLPSLEQLVDVVCRTQAANHIFYHSQLHEAWLHLEVTEHNKGFLMPDSVSKGLHI